MQVSYLSSNNGYVDRINNKLQFKIPSEDTKYKFTDTVTEKDQSVSYRL